MHSTIYILASAYGTSNYNTSAYNGAATSSIGTTNTQPTATGMLTNTGFDIALAVALASLLIVLAVVIRYWRRPATVPVES